MTLENYYAAIEERNKQLEAEVATQAGYIKKLQSQRNENERALAQLKAECERERELRIKAEQHELRMFEEMKRLRNMVRNLCMGHADNCNCYYCKEVFRIDAARKPKSDADILPVYFESRKPCTDR